MKRAAFTLTQHKYQIISEYLGSAVLRPSSQCVSFRNGFNTPLSRPRAERQVEPTIWGVYGKWFQGQNFLACCWIFFHRLEQMWQSVPQDEGACRGISLFPKPTSSLTPSHLSIHPPHLSRKRRAEAMRYKYYLYCYFWVCVYFYYTEVCPFTF